MVDLRTESTRTAAPRKRKLAAAVAGAFLVTASLGIAAPAAATVPVHPQAAQVQSAAKDNVTQHRFTFNYLDTCLRHQLQLREWGYRLEWVCQPQWGGGWVTIAYR